MWHDFLLASIILIFGGWTLSWIVGRFSSRRGLELRLLAGLVGRVAVVAVMAYSIERVVDRGGWFVALVAFFVLVGVASLFTGAVSAAALWLSVTGRFHQ